MQPQLFDLLWIRLCWETSLVLPQTQRQSQCLLLLGLVVAWDKTVHELNLSPVDILYIPPSFLCPSVKWNHSVDTILLSNVPVNH